MYLLLSICLNVKVWNTKFLLYLENSTSPSWCKSPPSWPGPPHYPDFTITLRHTPLGTTPLYEWSVRRSDLYLTTHDTLKIHPLPPGGIRTRNPRKRAAVDPHFRPRGDWDRHHFLITINNRCGYQSITQQYLKRCLIKVDSNYMFRPIADIIR